MNRLFVIAITAILSFSALAMLTTGFGPQASESREPVQSAVVAGSANTSDEEPGSSTRISRDSSGQFTLEAAVNGEEARFLVDTGADVVAVGLEEADRLGIAVDPANFTQTMRTASGTARAAVTTIDRMEVAGRELRDVQVAVIEGLEINLLGQSALRRLGSVAIKGDKMTIGG